MNNIQTLTAQQVMELVREGASLYTYMARDRVFIRNAYILEHSGYIRFHIYGVECGNNTFSRLPEDDLEVFSLSANEK